LLAVRKLELKDIIDKQESVYKIIKLIMQESFGNIKTLDNITLEKYNDMIEFQKNGSAILYGAFYESKLVGLMWAYERTNIDEKALHLTEIGVLEEYRKKGIGTALIQKLEMVAKKRKIKSIELMATKSNKNVCSFYLNSDFLIERYVMRKRL